jgi:N utilization substance protein B
MGVMSRARRFLLQARYAGELNGHTLEENLASMDAQSRFDAERLEWIESLGRATESARGEIDSSIEAKLENWKLERVSIVSRLIIEQAIAEVRFMSTPAPVAIDEAIELAKGFEADRAGSFVNAVLDAILRDDTAASLETEQKTKGSD